MNRKVSEITQQNALISSDLFLYSQTLNPYANIYYDDRTTYIGDVENQIIDGIEDELGLKSMAHEDKNAYSLVNHTHNYSKDTVDSFNTKGLEIDKQRERDSIISILAEIKIDGKKTNINAYSAHQPDPPTPDIGTLMFIAQKTLNPIDENASDFDGYVYPDGRLLKKTEFPEAFQCFGNTYTKSDDPTDSFRIPILSDFIKLNPLEEKTQCCRRNNFQNGIKAHTHEYQLNLTGIVADVDIKIKCKNGNALGGWANGKGVHQGNLHSQRMPDLVENAEVLLSSSNLYLETNLTSQTSDSTTETESTPNYMLLPVLMYIGEKVNG